MNDNHLNQEVVIEERHNLNWADSGLALIRLRVAFKLKAVVTVMATMFTVP